MGKNGFTLVELLASITLISIILFAFLGFFIQDAKFASLNSQKLVAVHLARQAITKNLQQFQNEGRDTVLADRCFTMPSDPPPHQYCFQQANPVKTLGGDRYKIWTFIQEDADISGYYPVIAQVYYGNGNFSETYGYYHPETPGDANE